MFSDRILAKMAEALNKHLPRKSRSLEEMLKEEFPTIKARDGEEYLIERDELEFIAEYVDELDRKNFSIPIILEMVGIGSETVVIVRNRLHADFIRKAFGFDRRGKEGLMLYTYEMREVRRRLRTATQVMFRVLE